MTDVPFAGLRIVELEPDLVAAICGKMLAEAGADVVSLREPGWASRLHLPAASDWDAYLGLDKHVVEVQWGEQADWRAWVGDADAVITSAPHAPEAAAVRPNCESLRGVVGDALLACVTAYGQSGPYQHMVADETGISALSGLSDATPGFPDPQPTDDAPPVQSLAPLTAMAAGITATSALTEALARRGGGAQGPSHVEVSWLEAAVSVMMYEWSFWTYGAELHGRRPGHAANEPNRYVACRDGYIVIAAISPRHWSNLVELMGDPQWAHEPQFADGLTRGRNWEALHHHLRDWAARQNGREIVAAAQQRGIPLGYALDLHDAVTSAQVEARATLREVDGRRYPADPVVVNGARRSVKATERTEPEAGAGPQRTPSASMSGIRVLDLGQVVAGPYAGQTLASLGAEVIMVESLNHSMARHSPPLKGEPTYDGSRLFNNVNRGKKSLHLDLTVPEGRATLLSLVREADVVLENFSRGAAQRLGVTYEALTRERSDIILGSISGFGRSGPWADYVALHSGVITMSGQAGVTRDAEGRPRLIGAIYPDFLAGSYLALALQQAVATRARTGAGSHVEISMMDVLIASMGGLVPLGYEDAGLPAGMAQFLQTAEGASYVAVCSEEDLAGEWAARVSVLPRNEAVKLLVDAGLRAYPVLDVSEVIVDRHLQERGFVVIDDHPVSGRNPVPGVPWLFDGDRPVLARAPRLGEHTGEVVQTMGDMSGEELERLYEVGALK